MKEYFSQNEYLASENTIIDSFDISLYTEKKISNANINLGGWQSWNPGFEIMQNEKQPSLHCHILKQWNTYIEFPGTKQKASKNIV
ncbi:MAG: hypothetical protein MJ188_11355 [Treponema sp.]|nr:hypothetical protein [Treponema sp.]